MKVLLISNAGEDYLQDCIIHGFKELLGKDAIDYPLKAELYHDYDKIAEIRGGGFTLYGLLDAKLKPDQIAIDEEISKNSFDLIVFTSIFRQYKLFYKLYPLLKPQRQKVWIMEGEDQDNLFPYLRPFIRRRPSLFFAPRPHRSFKYFKRELTTNTIKSYNYGLISDSKAKRSALHKNIHPISFSIPMEKIVKAIPVKTQLFASHIVDKEIVEKMQGASMGYAFRSEKEYYADIQKSKFGITTKRGGWDCLRHYEIAANGTVICFRNLEDKPPLCAPHGLIPGTNCISYNSYEDLTSKISLITDEEYNRLLINSLEWIRQNTTIESVKNLLKDSTPRF